MILFNFPHCLSARNYDVSLQTCVEDHGFQQYSEVTKIEIDFVFTRFLISSLCMHSKILRLCYNCLVYCFNGFINISRFCSTGSKLNMKSVHRGLSFLAIFSEMKLDKSFICY